MDYLSTTLPEIRQLIAKSCNGISRIMLSFTCKSLQVAANSLPRSFEGEYSDEISTMLLSIADKYTRNDEINCYDRLNNLVKRHASLSFLMEFGTMWSANDFAYCGRVDVLKHLWENNIGIFSFIAVESAVEGGSLECLQFLFDKGMGLTQESLNIAVENGHLECFKYLHEKFTGEYESEIYCYSAARKGHLNCLQYIHENGGNWDDSVFKAGLSSQSEPVIVYLEKEGCPVPDDVLDVLAMNGDLARLQKYYSLGYTITNVTINYTIRGNHLECFKYLVSLFPSGKCPWDVSTSRIGSGKPEFEKILREGGCPEYKGLVYIYEADDTMKVI